MRVYEQDPPHDHGETRDKKGEPEQELNPVPLRNVSPPDDPCQGDGNGPADNAGAKIDADGVPDRTPDTGLPQSGPPSIQAKLQRLAGSRYMKAVDYQEEDRPQNHHGHHYEHHSVQG